MPKEAVEFTRAVSALEGVEVEGFFTHFARADEIDLSSARAQLAKFERVLGGLSAAGLRPPLIHSANSAATLTLPEARYDLVRCGVAI